MVKKRFKRFKRFQLTACPNQITIVLISISKRAVGFQPNTFLFEMFSVQEVNPTPAKPVKKNY